MTPGATVVLRFRSTLDVVRREGRHLLRTDSRLFEAPIDAAWICALEIDDNLAERLEAFVSRFGRMQDTIGEKLIPRLLILLDEKPGSHIDNVNRAEKLGVLASAALWRDTRELRNRMIHEYMEDPVEFAAALNRAHERVPMLIETGNAANRYAKARFGVGDVAWPEEI